MTNLETLLYWVAERQAILTKREAGLPKPWTLDPILQSYRFCNVCREDDTVTKWLKNHWRDPYDGSTLMPLAMVVARTVNWPETLEAIGFPEEHTLKWMDNARETMKYRRAQKQKVWTGAYLISTNGIAMDKIDYIVDRVWTPFHLKGRMPLPCETLENYHKHLMQFDGLGSFIAAQVVCDLKYTSALAQAPDWHTWAASGPGSRRGMNRIHNRPPGAPQKESAWFRELTELRALLPALHAQDIQSVLCEVDKYIRVKNNEGKPRSGYDGI